MKWSVATLGLAATALAAPQAAPTDLKPQAQSPQGCSANYDGKFEISIFTLNSNAKRSLHKRDCGGDTLTLTLENGVLTDNKNRTGAIVANNQFQFDGPPQAGTIYDAGFSVCQNGSLAIGPSTVFWQCQSGDFYNIYDKDWAEQCSPIEMVAMSCSGQQENGGSPMQSAVGTSMVVTTVVDAISDGQPQIRTTTVPVAMCQIGDGQVQAQTTPCNEAPGAAVTQISDGQIQAPTNLPAVSQIPDGQVQVPTGAPVTQIGDGQVQAPSATGAPVTQISDGQIQAPSAVTGAPISQISDGQIQAPVSQGVPVTQIGDGQIQVSNKTAPVVPPTGGGAKAVPGLVGALFAAGLGALVFL